MGEILRNGLEEVGGVANLLRAAVRQFFSRPFEGEQIRHQLHELGVRSLSITTITAIFTGMVLALETAYTLAQYGARLLIGKAVALSMVQELGPVLTAIVVAGRVGAGITAEIGTMTVTEQVDAIRALGADPVKKLVMPKMLALLLMVPLLTVIADAVGIAGGCLISVTELGSSVDFYVTSLLQALVFSDFFSGLG